MYKSYFSLNIHQRINERQVRNLLNINNLFASVVCQGNYKKYTTEHPIVTNGIYHHIGKNHSKYPKK
jgi:hypothetical protein